MKTQNANSQFNFSGLTDWFEVFRAGTHVDSKGRENTFTTDDLDSIVANHTADQSAPLVVGHPKDNHPAYGWTAGLKRVGEVLLAKAENVVAEFEEAVKAKQYRHRSISIVPTENGYRLRHIGFLGAVPPAVPGLADIAFAAEDDAIEFAVDDAVRGLGWRLQTIGSVLRRFKNWFIAEHGAEAADQLLPEFDLEYLAGVNGDVQASLADPVGQSFSHGLKTENSVCPEDRGDNHTEDNGMPDPKTYTQQELEDAIVQANKPLLDRLDAMEAERKTSAFNQKLTAAKTLVTGLVNEGKLLPANAQGMAEFLANLPDGAEVAFEFSVGDGDKAETKTAQPFDFMAEFLRSLPKAVRLGRREDGGDPDQSAGHEFSAPSGAKIANADLDRKAMEYSQKHNVSYVDAVRIVSQED